MYSQEKLPPVTHHDEQIDENNIEETEQTHHAREIARQGNFAEIKIQLNEEGLLVNEIKRVRETFTEVFADLEFLTYQDIEMFTILELYDHDLALHSIETYNIAKAKVEKRLEFDIVLVDLFAKEGVTDEQFFRACLLHDIGKVEVPNFILNNTIHNDEMQHQLEYLVFNKHDNTTIHKLDELAGEHIEIKNESELETFLDEHHVRSVHLVPIKALVSEVELSILQNRGIDPEASLMDIIATHEEFSRVILERAGLPVESALAGSHHNYHGQGSDYAVSIEALQLSVAIEETIRIADITEALTATRSYKKNFSRPKVFKIILDKVKSHEIKPIMAYIWLTDDIKALESNEPDNFTVEDLSILEEVKQELELIRQNLGEDPLHLKQAA